MKTSLVIATLVVVGAGAAGAGATFAVQPFVGSDTEYEITNQAIANSGLGNFGDYTGGGSGAGESAMTSSPATQRTAPMSKMMTATTCTVKTPSTTAYTHATGIAIALDAVNIYSSIFAGGVAACNGTADNTGLGLVYDGGVNAGDAGTASFPNWTDMLALLYGGLDKQTKITDCASPKRKALVASWGNLFQANYTSPGSCTGPTTCTTANYFSTTNPGGTYKINGALWHAFRRDDNSGTSDAFAGLIGLGQLTDPAGNKTIKPSPGISQGGVNGFGQTLYCNAMNWDTRAANAHCGLGAHKQFLGPGGIPNAAAADGGLHRSPPPGTWGDVPDSSMSNDAAVLPTSYQDNDPIRQPCLGLAGDLFNNPGEEVCNRDGTLGLVLPVPAVDFVQHAGKNPYPTAACGGAAATTGAFNVYDCAPDNVKQPGGCPNGDVTFGGGCVAATVDGSNTFCEAGPNDNQLLGTNTTYDGRVYNLTLTNGTTDYTYFNVPSVPTLLPFTGHYGRIHSQTVVWDTAHPANKGVPCQMGDATDNIGCLAQASPCSVGYAGDGAKSWGSRATYLDGGSTPSNNQPLRVSQIAPTVTTVQNGAYFLWRKIYLNSSGGFDSLADAGAGPKAELQLAEFESKTSSITPILAQYGFFGFGASPNGGGDTPFCEDYNETLLGCTDAGNQNACNFNASIPLVPPTGGDAAAFAAIPSDPSPNQNAASTSTVCGNGIKEKFEDCDNGLANGTSGNNCSATCRLVFP
jgi:hypothetical protein